MIKRIVKTIIIDDENDVNVGGIVPEGFSANSVKAVEPDNDVIDVIAGGGEVVEIDNAYDAFSVKAGPALTNAIELDFNKRESAGFWGLGGFFVHNNSHESYAFNDTSFPNSVNRYCKIVLPDSTNAIYSHAFARCAGLINIDYNGDNDIVVAANAFVGCYNLKSIGNLWGHIKQVYTSAFYTRADANGGVTFENGGNIVAPKLEIGGNYAFGGAAFKSFSAPKMTKCGADTFVYCQNLERVELNTINSIPAECFAYCSSLKEIVLGSGVALEDTSAFGSTPFQTNPTACHIYVPGDDIEFYENDTNWSVYKQLGVNFEEV